MALALYRKYRPAKFSEVVGQEHVTDPLSTALAAGRINHAYLFSGPRGCGKTSSARILARSLNCELGPTPDPCGVCPSCISLAPGGPGNIDVTELDAASHGGVDDTRELRDRAFFAPAESRYRVFIVDEAHMITTQGFNALLKIVEEPPEHLVFVFATTEPDKVLPTIRSRTHHYPFRLIPPGTLRKLMERICADEGAVVAPAVFPLVIRAGGGSARDSLSVLDQLLAGAGPEGVTYERAVALLGVTDVALIDDVVDALAASDRAAVFEAVDRLVEAGHDPRRFAADLLQRLRDLTLLQAVPEAAERGLVEAADDELARMIEQAGKIGQATLARYSEIVHTGLTEMRGATAPRLLLELLCARMLLPAATVAEPGLLERLERLERRNAIASAPLPADETGAEPAEPAEGRRRFQRPSERSEQPAGAPPRGDGRAERPPATAAGPRTTDPRGGSSAEPPGAAESQGRAAGARPDADPRGAAAPPAAPGLQGGAAGGRSGADPRDGAATERDRSDQGGERAAADPRREAAGGRPGVESRGSAAQRPGGDESAGGRRGTDGAGRRPGTSGAPYDGAGSGAAAVPDDSASRVDGGASGRPAAPAAAAPLDAAAVRRAWPEVLAVAKERKKRTAALLVSATVRAVENDTLVLSIGTAPLARLLSEQSNTEVIAEALHAVLGVRWRVRCEHGDGPAAAPASSSASPAPASSPPAPQRRPVRPPPVRRSTAPEDGVPLPPEPPEEEPPPDDEESMIAEAAAEPIAAPVERRDPEEAAIELLSAQLGARAIDHR
ncbi:DNA polymerase III subunit gamma and tau [Pseudonocardia yunnanensis]|uniref:DNA polymerase III subunit gamma/tau n=1 Tax=Pseudonocardia yunnanensis TaxID=58107 RepID=A0ABW4EXQ4_9PSEU